MNHTCYNKINEMTTTEKYYVFICMRDDVDGGRL